MYLLLQFTMVVHLEIFLWTSLPQPQPWLVNCSPSTKISRVSEYVGYTQNMYLLLQFTMVVHLEIFLWTSLPLPQPWLVNYSPSTKISKVQEYVGYTQNMYLLLQFTMVVHLEIFLWKRSMWGFGCFGPVYFFVYFNFCLI